LDKSAVIDKPLKRLIGALQLKGIGFMSYVVVGVRFKQAGKIYFFDPTGIELKPGDYVIVETARGLEHGQVMVEPKKVAEDKVTLPLKNVIRVATPEDNAQLADNQEREKKAIVICQEKVNHHKLDMKLVDVEYTFDRSKIIFYFTADGRVDFRELVKDLAAVFRTRIELRQIGVRDEAKMLGGLGPCGRPLCCATFLGDFEPVSIKMAKEQNLSLNPVKISGICSRLMCCLKYESSCYRETKSDVPLVGSKVRYDGREGKILANNQLKETLLVDFGSGDKREILLSEVEEIILAENAGSCKKNCKCSQSNDQPENQPNDQPGGQPKNQPNDQPGGQPKKQPNDQPGGQPKNQTNERPNGRQRGQQNVRPNRPRNNQHHDRQNNQLKNHPENKPNEQPKKQPDHQRDAQSNSPKKEE
jgi:cell fate regulator YaaT (PSP1 superfamily)